MIHFFRPSLSRYNTTLYDGQYHMLVSRWTRGQPPLHFPHAKAIAVDKEAPRTAESSQYFMMIECRRPSRFAIKTLRALHDFRQLLLELPTARRYAISHDIRHVTPHLISLRFEAAGWPPSRHADALAFATKI